VRKLLCLDIGCGTDVSYGFNPRCPRHSEAVLLDIEFPSPDVRRFTRNSPSLHFVVASAEYLPFRSGVADLAYMWHVLEHTCDVSRAARELRRVLKSGGLGYVAVPNFLSRNATADPSHRHIFNPVKLWRLLKRAGCRHVVFMYRAGSKLPRLLRLLVLAVMSFLSEEVAVVCVG